MKRSAFALVLVGCTPALSDLMPHVEVQEARGRFFVAVDFDSDQSGLAIDAMFRGETVHLQEHDAGRFYDADLPLDTPLVADEPVEISIDGATTTITAPPALDPMVPLFISRSQDATISWTTASPDRGVWFTHGICAQASGELMPNTTSLTIAPSDWMLQATGTCTTDFELGRIRLGALADAFGGGNIDFIRSYDTQFASTP